MIGMGKNISKTGKASPIHFRSFIFYGFIQIFHGFADDFKTSNGSEISFRVAGKRLKISALHERKNGVCIIGNVL